ncbi:MAG TPA: NADH-quinone oxidoreductase subunit H, partial [Methanomassiliicoccaceae archaeon]|nr:NADH-quinone oxidoreductase subunit H [Methanomassiliicoccaceae archaeon]
MYLDLWGLVGGLVHWLMVDVIGTILNWLHIYALAEWLGSPGVLNIVTILVVALIILIVGMLVSITLIWQERKMLGRFMDRVGTQVGPFGLFQNFADAF